MKYWIILIIIFLYFIQVNALCNGKKCTDEQLCCGVSTFAICINKTSICCDMFGSYCSSGICCSSSTGREPEWLQPKPKSKIFHVGTFTSCCLNGAHCCQNEINFPYCCSANSTCCPPSACCLNGRQCCYGLCCDFGQKCTYGECTLI